MTAAPLTLTESIAHSIRAYGPHCIGCQRHGAHVMISYTNMPKHDEICPPIHDLFLTESQALDLLHGLEAILRP